MKRFSKIFSIILVLVIALGCVNIPSNKVQADSSSYSVVVGSTNYGTYPLYESVSNASEYVKANMAVRTENFSFYIADPSISASNDATEALKNLISNAMRHDGNINTGDYLEMGYSRYSLSYLCFKNYYKNPSGAFVDLYRVTLNFTYYTNTSEEQYVNQMCSSIISLLNLTNKTEYEKALAIYSWIAANVVYDYSNVSADSLSKSFTAYGALVNKKAVCQGFSTLMYRMFLEAGIDNRICFNATHCWNIVKIDGQYYYCDPTWDFGNNSNNFRYFLKGTSSSFTTEHNITSSSVNRYYTVSSKDYVVPKPSNTVANSGTTSNVSSNNVTTIVVDNSLKGFVSRLYTVALSREAEPAGLQYWIDEISSGRTSAGDVAGMFISSTEFVNRRLDNTAFLAVLYRTFFDREMDEAGKNYWLNELANGVSRETIVAGFAVSNEWNDILSRYGLSSVSANRVENVSAFVNRMYTSTLCRDADPSGLKYWTDKLINKEITGTQAAYGFVTSNEFVNSNISNGEYINRMYNLFLGREADVAGYNYWVNLMNSGYSRMDVFNGFSVSNEFASICASYGINK